MDEIGKMVAVGISISPAVNCADTLNSKHGEGARYPPERR